jgi:hypothetical protein
MYWSNYRKLAAELLIRYHCNHTQKKSELQYLFEAKEFRNVTAGCVSYVESRAFDLHRIGKGEFVPVFN